MLRDTNIDSITVSGKLRLQHLNEGFADIKIMHLVHQIHICCMDNKVSTSCMSYLGSHHAQLSRLTVCDHQLNPEVALQQTFALCPGEIYTMAKRLQTYSCGQ